MNGPLPKGLTREEWASLAQGTAEHLAEVLQSLLGQSYDEFDGLALDEDGNIVITPQQAWALTEAVSDVLPRCFSHVPGRAPQCRMPDGVCFPCAGEGRSVPAGHPLREGEEA